MSSRLPYRDAYLVKNALLQLVDTDTVTGLPTRRTFTANFQRWLITQPEGSRYVAAHINLPTVHSESGSNGVDSTLQDLLAYRASVLLIQNTRHNTLLGRCDRQSLLLVQLCRRNKSSNTRGFLKSLLGNLGGLVDDDKRIGVTTLIASTVTFSAHEALQRLPLIPSTVELIPEKAPTASAGDKICMA